MSDMMMLHIEGATIDELRAKAVLALDLRIEPAAKVAEKVKELLAESEDNNTPAINVPSPEVAAPAAKPAIRRKIGHPPAPANLKPPVKPKKPAKKTMESRFVKPAPEPAPLDLDDIKDAFNRYVVEFGPNHILVDGPVILRRIYGDGIERLGQVPLGDQSKLARVVAAVDAAIMTNEFKREVLTSGPEVST